MTSSPVYCTNIVRWASTSYDVVRDVIRHRTIIFGYPIWTRIAAIFWTSPRIGPDDCDVVQRRTIYPRWSPITLRSPIVWPVWPLAKNLKFNARPSLVYIVRWRCTTSCDLRLVRHSKIILRSHTMLGIAAKFLNITNTPKTSGDDPWWLRRRTTSHDYTRFTPDGPRSPNLPIVVWRRKGR